ncbi:MAG: CocE/NonD family hydrolase C-terminal non-catalytic domain-containing protein, partial [Wenzhouxiangellaceae bacterium]
RWLKDEANGIDAEPMLRVWMQDSVPPTTQYSHRPGRWVAEEQWPPPDLKPREYGLSGSGWLVAGAVEADESECILRSPLSVGLYAGKWCSYAAGPDLAYDQREEDGGALVFETLPLEEAVEILGRPQLELEFRVDRPVAMVAVRLSDVAPDGRATRVTYGLLNLTHRDGAEQPEPLEPGRRYRVQVRMNDIGQGFPVGHRIRLSLSTSYWPLAWPPPEPVEMRVYPTRSMLRLPVRKPRPGDSALAPFAPPEAA